MTLEIDYISPERPSPDPITGEVEGVYSQNTQHAAEAISHLIQYFRDGPRNQSILAAVGAQLQQIEDASWAVYHGFDVNTAVGDQLDLLGKLVGEGRQDRIDSEYRTAVRVRILVNGSDGQMWQLLAICAGISPTAVVTARDFLPAAIALEFDTFGGSNLQAAYRLLRAAKPAGVRLNLTALGASAWGAVDGSPAGGVWGAVDGSPAGFSWAGGT